MSSPTCILFDTAGGHESWTEKQIKQDGNIHGFLVNNLAMGVAGFFSKKSDVGGAENIHDELKSLGIWL